MPVPTIPPKKVFEMDHKFMVCDMDTTNECYEAVFESIIADVSSFLQCSSEKAYNILFAHDIDNPLEFMKGGKVYEAWTEQR